MGENYHHYRITKANSNRPISLTTISQRTRRTTAHAGLRGSSREILNVLCVCVFSVLANSTFSSLIIYYFLPLPNGKKIPVSVSASSLHIIPGALLFYHPQRPDLIELSLLQFPTPNMVYDGPWKLLPSSYIMTTCSD